VPAGRPLLEARTCLRFVWSIIGAACALASVTDGEIMAREIRSGRSRQRAQKVFWAPITDDLVL